MGSKSNRRLQATRCASKKAWATQGEVTAGQRAYLCPVCKKWHATTDSRTIRTGKFHAKLLRNCSLSIRKP